MTAHMLQMSTDLGNGAERAGGEVPNILYSGFLFPGLLELSRPGPEVQLQPLHSTGVPVLRSLREDLHYLMHKMRLPL